MHSSSALIKLQPIELYFCIVVNHVWLGADWGPIKVDGTINDWRWATNFNPVSEYMKSMPFLYYPTELTFGRVCLNMDRENHNELLLYGLACNKTQFFVCENRTY